MRPGWLVLGAAAAWLACGAPVGAGERAAAAPPGQLLAQIPRLPPAGGKPDEPPPPHRAGELECRGCHEDEHQGVVRMYLGMGGRGTPMIPSHMFQVRVECVACHVAPKEAAGRARIVGQTFRPSEQACVNCHGEKYRGMLDRWNGTLGKMRDIVTPKLAAARAGLAAVDVKDPKRARAAKLAEDAEFNLQFVTFAKGIHNVFYAADLLKLANVWLDESARLTGKSPAKVDDALVRGGYCGVMCHEQAGVKLPETVAFAKQRVPHAKHVSEFGAVCTACHSADVHKAVTATAATCTSCHHSPQNERCEGCHRAQSAFFRGEAKSALAKAEPDVMAKAVGCTGCHDLSTKHSRQAVTEKCIGCHDAGYRNFVAEWTTGADKEVASATAALRQAESRLTAARRAGRKNPDAQALVKGAREALALVRVARPAHNPALADGLLDGVRKRSAEAVSKLERP
ncbi:MAG: hypothetical protein A2X52_15645 [Candidatus Rokubacteria bacterium GWC2_70_16]|nr:MAG: hypothetical protein A2X52_15645 [Candidatus Rokubacteria bacterium GWC2_70_16]